MRPSSRRTASSALGGQAALGFVADRADRDLLAFAGTRIGLRALAADRQAAAEQYVLEALRDEPGLMVEQVTLAENGGKSSLTVNAVKDERRLTAEVALGQEGVTM